MKPYKSLFETKRMKAELDYFMSSFKKDMLSKSRIKKMSLMDKVGLFSMFSSIQMIADSSSGKRSEMIKRIDDGESLWNAMCEAERSFMKSPSFISIGGDDWGYFDRIQLSDKISRTIDKLSHTCFLIEDESIVDKDLDGDGVIFKSITVSKGRFINDMSSAYEHVNKWQKANNIRIFNDMARAIKNSNLDLSTSQGGLNKDYIIVYCVGESVLDGSEVVGMWMIDEDEKTLDKFTSTAIKGAFHIAMNQDCLVEQEYIEMPKAVAPTRKAKRYKMKEPSKKIKKSPHYRNLRHEKFYRGEYEKMERGTRWVPVNAKFYNIED